MNLAQESLGFRRTGFSPVLSLLTSAYALPKPPALLAVHLQRRLECSPTTLHLSAESAASVDSLSPVVFSAQIHLTSELLRFLSRVAASKPTSWLSVCFHILYHLTVILGP